MEEAMVHENNFRETIKNLVIQDQNVVTATARNLRDSDSDDKDSHRDSDTDVLIKHYINQEEIHKEKIE